MKDKKPSQLRSYASMAWYSFRAQTRNKATFFFGFLFPIVFISIFGLIGNSSTKITIGIPSDADQTNQITKEITQQTFIKTDIEDKSVLETKLQQGKLAGIVSVQNTSFLTPHYQVNVLTSTASPQDGATLISFLRGVVDETNLKIAGVKSPAITLDQESISGRQFRYIDFALPGQIGFALLSTAIFGTVFGLIFLKKSLVLKRMFVTPTKPLTILLAQGISRLVMAELQTILILLLGVLVFKFYLPHGIITFLELMLLSGVGLVAFLGFGYFMAGLTNDENSANPLVNLVTLPQFLLSGVFFSPDNFPSWIQPIANNLPLSYFNMAVRKITTEGGSLLDTKWYMVGLILWGLVMYLLAARTFKWE